MKNFQHLAVVLIALFFSSNSAIAQCDDDPIVDWSVVDDISIFTSAGDGYCPNTMADVDVSVSGEVTIGDVASGNTGDSQCDLDQITISFSDVFGGGCPEEIERTWIVEYNTINGGIGEDQFVQIITLEDDVDPVIDNAPPSVDVLISDSCDENDAGVETESGFAFSGAPTGVDVADFPGDITEDCIISNNGAVDEVSYMDVWIPEGCPGNVGVIERTWTVTDECDNFTTAVQMITLMDQEPPEITTCPPDITLELVDACDETDSNIEVVTGFMWSSGQVAITQAEFQTTGGVFTELCDMDLTAYYMDSDLTYIDGNCPNEFISFIRTWSLEDECGNLSDECDQMVLIFDNTPPTIVQCPGNGVPIEIDIVTPDPCDESNPEIEAQSGFAFSAAPVMLTEDEFSAWGIAEDNCNDGLIESAEYFDEILGTGCETGFKRALDIVRHWTVTDLCGNTSTCDQEIWLLDNEAPTFDLFPDFFYDQFNEDPGLGVWEIESIFCNITIDFPAEYTLPGPAEILDNCTMFPNLMISYTPDISAGPIDLAEGDNEILVVISDECGNRFDDMFIITMVCVGCGPDDIFEACTDPPTICDLEEITNFSSCTPEFTTGFGSLCSGFSLDNPSYFEFIAGAEDLEFIIQASNCSDGQGIQAVVTDPCDATTCYTDLDGNLIMQGEEATVAASGLTVGNIYQLVVDGWGGDECNWSILDISATPFSIPDPTPEDEIAEMPDFPGCGSTDDLIFCQGSTVAFWPDTFEEALYFFCWSLDNQNGVTSSNGEEDCTENTALETLGQSFECTDDFSSCGPLELTFTEIGIYNLCLTELENGCDNQAPPDYCWEITIVENGPILFDPVNVCQHDLEAGWFPDVDGPNGESWQGDAIFTEGLTSDFVADDCGCEFEYIIEVNLLPEVEVDVEMSVCAADLENFFDPGLGIDWNDLEDYYQEPFGFPPFAHLDPLEEASMQTGYDGIACDTFMYITFFLYDVPGEIVQVPGPVCDVILELELDSDLFPEDLIDPDDFFYFWYNGSNDLLSTEPTVSVTEIDQYELIVEYDLDDGTQCSFLFEIDVSDFGNPPASPTFVASPNETCITELDGIIYSVPPAANATYLWAVTNGTFTPNAGNDEITITITDPTIETVVCVSADSNCGPSPETCETITVTPSPVVELLPIMDVCIDQAVTIGSMVTAGSADEFFWTIPGGSFTQAGSSMASSLVVSWPAAGTYMIELSVEDPAGCQSNITTLEVNVLDALAPPTASCSLTTSNSVEITLVDNPNGGAGSTYIVTSGQAATDDNGIITVTGLTPGDEVNVLFTTLGGTHPCGDQSDMIMCIAMDCPLNPALQQEDDICLDGTEAPFQLMETAGNPGGIWSGPGTDATGMFDPAAAGPGTHAIEYIVEDVAADCMAMANTTIVVYPTPIEDFAASVDTVCLDEFLSIAFDDSQDKTYTWDFDADNSNPITDDTDFTVGYSTPGDKQITMTISTGPDCEYSVTHDIYVRPALVFPGVFCGTLSPVSVGFEWDAIAGVTEFEYSYTTNGNDEVTGTTTETDITIDGLTEGDIIDIMVTAIDLNGCSNPVEGELCIAQDCPAFVIDITASETAVCYVPGISIQLMQETTLDNNPANGTGSWSGPDGLDEITGEFIPEGVGSYVLIYTFEEDGTACPATETIMIDILESPESEFTQDFDEICIEDVVTFTLDGVYNAAYDYDWTSTFPDDDYDLVDNGDGTFTVEFFDEGSGDFSLITSVAGCESPESTATVEVGLVPDLPVISCTEDLGYILFEWTEVDCASSYLVYLNDQFEIEQTETEIELTGLDPNETIEIRIEIESDCLCEFPDSVSETCTAQDCAEAEITIDTNVAQEYCSSSLPLFTITATVEGDEIDNSGAYTWSGDGVDADGNIDFSGFEPGDYEISVAYLEDDCSYNESIILTVLADPELAIETFNAPCPGALGEVMVNGTGNGPFVIDADGNSLTEGPNQLQAGSYNVTIADANGCEFDASFTIGVDAEPTDDLIVPLIPTALNQMVNFNYTTSQEDLENVVWTVNGEVLVDLNCATEDCFNVEYTAPTEGSYEVCTYAYYDGAVCELIECRTYDVFQIPFNSFYIPNIITPDNETDPINTSLTIFVEGDAVTIHSVGIYDRWGNRVFFNDEEIIVETDEAGELWNGRFEDNKDFTGGVYVYLIDTEIDGVREFYTDDITVMN